jgi:hypothetical protein
VVRFKVAVMLLPRFDWLRTSCSRGFGTSNVEFLYFVT